MTLATLLGITFIFICIVSICVACNKYAPNFWTGSAGTLVSYFVFAQIYSVFVDGEMMHIVGALKWSFLLTIPMQLFIGLYYVASRESRSAEHNK